MKGFYKKQEDGSILKANEIHAPGISLTEENKETYDGWRWFDTSEEAYTYYSTNSDTATPRQIRLAMLSLGITPNQIDAMIGDNEAAKIEWHYASVIKRDHPLVVSLGTALNKTTEEIDALFQYAKTL